MDTVPSAPQQNQIYGNAYPVYAHQRFTPPPESVPVREEIIVQIPQEPVREEIIVQIPQTEDEPVYDASLSIYVAACISMFFPIIGLIYITIYVCCVRSNQRSLVEKTAFKMLCIVTFLSIFLYIIVGTGTSSNK